MELHELAAHVNSYFIRGKRPSGEEFWAMKRRRPVWVRGLVDAIHGEMAGEDYKYQFLVDTLDALEEENNPDDPQLEPDAYDSERIKWLGSHAVRSSYVDEATEVLGHSSDGVIGDIGNGQLAEKDEVWRIVVQHLRERLEEIDRPEEFEGPKKGVKDWSPKERE